VSDKWVPSLPGAQIPHFEASHVQPDMKVAEFIFQYTSQWNSLVTKVFFSPQNTVSSIVSLPLQQLREPNSQIW